MSQSCRAELEFAMAVLEKMRIRAQVLEPGAALDYLEDGIREALGLGGRYAYPGQAMERRMMPGTIYKVENPFLCHYICNTGKTRWDAAGRRAEKAPGSKDVPLSRGLSFWVTSFRRGRGCCSIPGVGTDCFCFFNILPQDRGEGNPFPAEPGTAQCKTDKK